MALEKGARAARSTQAYALRCKIVLRCAEPGSFDSHVAAELGVSHPTVAKWRKRFIERGLAGLADEGRPPSILLDKVQQVIAATLEETPADATHWSRASMARRSGLSESTVGRIWRKFDLKPHLTDGFKLSTDPLFTEKVVDVVGLYHNPPERAVVLCVDEKTQVQALDRSQPVLPMMPGMPGMPERRSHDYVRHGTTSPYGRRPPRKSSTPSPNTCNELQTENTRAATYPRPPTRTTSDITRERGGRGAGWPSQTRGRRAPCTAASAGGGRDPRLCGCGRPCPRSAGWECGVRK